MRQIKGKYRDKSGVKGSIAIAIATWWKRHVALFSISSLSTRHTAAAGRRSLAFAMGRHGRLGAGSPVRRLDDLLISLILASPTRPFPGA